MSDDLKLFSDEIRRRERERRRREPLWGLVSFLAHLVVFALIILLSPVKDLIVPEPKKQEEMVISGDRIETMAERLNDSRIQELLRQLQDMQSVLHNMDVMKEQLAEDFDQIAQSSAEDVRTQLENLIKEADVQQKRAEAAQQAVRQAAQNLPDAAAVKAESVKEDVEALKQAIDKLAQEAVACADSAQANAMNALDKIQSRAAFAGFQKTTAAAEKLREAQYEVNALQIAAEKSVPDQAERAKQALEKALHPVRALEGQLVRNERLVADHEAVIARQQSDIDALRQKVEEREAREKERLESLAAKVSSSEEELKTDQQRLADSKAKARQAQADEREASRDKQKSDQQVAKVAKEMAAAQDRVEKLKAQKKFDEAKAVEKSIEERKAERDRASEASAEAQRKVASAKEVQKREQEVQKRCEEAVPEARKALEQARKAEREARAEIDRMKQDLARKQAWKTQLEAQIPAKREEQAKRAAELERKLSDARIEAKKAAEVAMTELRQAFSAPELQESLKTAHEDQKALNEQLAVLSKTLAEDEARPDKQAQEDRKENELVDMPPPESIVEAYEMARKLEMAIADSYKDLKATQTAITHKMSVDAAQKITDVAKPERPEADKAALEAKPRTKEDFDRQRKAQAEVIRETNTMVESTVAMMNDAMDIVMAGQQNKPQLRNEQSPREVKRIEAKDLAAADQAERLAAMKAESDFTLEAEAAASDDSDMNAKDMTAYTQDGGPQTPAKAKAEEEGKDATPDKKGQESQLAGEQSGPPQTLKGGDLQLVPGNVMVHGSNPRTAIPAKWMYVSSWYVIGPFANPGRLNKKKRFAPESAVLNLDATYTDGGRPLKWRPWQANNYDQCDNWHNLLNAAEVDPTGKKPGEKPDEYVIYYAYAEVVMDKACDRWIAIGSDDYSSVWLNDTKIWDTKDHQKEWRLADDFCRVHFKQGRNRIMVRLENGHNVTGFSLCISVGDEKAPLGD